MSSCAFLLGFWILITFQETSRNELRDTKKKHHQQFEISSLNSIRLFNFPQTRKLNNKFKNFPNFLELGAFRGRYYYCTSDPFSFICCAELSLFPSALIFQQKAHYVLYHGSHRISQNSKLHSRGIMPSGSASSYCVESEIKTSSTKQSGIIKWQMKSFSWWMYETTFFCIFSRGKNSKFLSRQTQGRK